MSENEIVDALVSCFKRKGTCYIAGNGGSAAEASHLAAEFIHDGLPAVSLASDMAVVTSTSNDFSFKEVFARQLIALGREGDVFIGISSSGKSENILYAYEWAEKLGLDVIDFPRDGKDTQEIQENQLKLIHRVWKAVVERMK